MSEFEDMIADTTRRIFQDLGRPQDIILAGDESWRTPLWAALEDAGLTRAWAGEEFGGAGLGAAATFTILRVAGEYGVAVPLAETILATHLLAEAGILAPEGSLAVAPAASGDGLTIDSAGQVSGRSDAVPFANGVDHLVCLAEGEAGPTVALITIGDCGIDSRTAHSSDSRDGVVLNGVAALEHAPSTIDADGLRRLGAAMRAAQMAGAMQGLLDISVDYAQERIAFGRPIGKFQAVQHLLARLAEETAAALAAAGSVAHALDTLPLDSEAVFVEVAAAKIRAGEAAGEAALIAHQTHGAIGFTLEHPLHRLVQRMWDWRDDFGGEAEWSLPLGRLFAGKGSGGFWPAITAI